MIEGVTQVEEPDLNHPQVQDLDDTRPPSSPVNELKLDIPLQLQREMNSDIPSTTDITPSPSLESLNAISTIDELPSPSGILRANSSIILPSQQRKWRLREIFRMHRRRKKKAKEMENTVESAPQTTCEKVKYYSKKMLSLCVPKYNQKKNVPLEQVLYRDMEKSEKDAVRSLIIDLGYALSVYGVPAHRLEDHLTRVATYFGLDGYYFSTPTSLWFTFGSKPSDINTQYHLIRIKGTSMDLHKLCLIDNLAFALSRGKYTVEGARGRLEEIINEPTSYSNRIVQAVSYLLCSLAFAMFLESTWGELVASTVAGLFVGILAILAPKFAFIDRVFIILSSLVSGVIGLIFKVALHNYCRVAVYTVSLSGVISLVPGLTLTLSMAELATNNIVSGSARLTSALICTLQIGLGVALTYRIGTLFNYVELPFTFVYPDWLLAIAVLLFAFAIMVQLHAPTFPFSVVCMIVSCYLGFFISKYLGILIGVELGALIGAIVVGLCGDIFSKVTNHPGIVVTGVGILILVPGSISVHSVHSLISNDPVSALNFLFNMFMVGVSLVVGLFISHFFITDARLNL